MVTKVIDFKLSAYKSYKTDLLLSQATELLINFHTLELLYKLGIIGTNNAIIGQSVLW